MYLSVLINITCYRINTEDYVMTRTLAEISSAQPKQIFTLSIAQGNKAQKDLKILNLKS